MQIMVQTVAQTKIKPNIIKPQEAENEAQGIGKIEVLYLLGEYCRRIGELEKTK